MEQISNSQLQQHQQQWPALMGRAMELAARVLSAHPNPRVGCVLEKQGRIIAEGWHEAPGLPHAEAMALAMAGEQAAQATVFVTLEPCSHHGRTGPCSDALINAGVAEVVIAGLDPNPSVAGQGVAALQQAGIRVWQLSDFEAEARALNPGYFKRREQGLPLVRLKAAMSLDGRTAMADGEAKWITGAEARADVQRLRLASDAILTGVNTILLDDPSLNVRPENLRFSEAEQQANSQLLRRQPLRVILDSHLRTPAAARTLGIEGQCLVYTTAEAAGSRSHLAKAELHSVSSESGRVHLASVLESLARDHECNEILVEAGPTLGGAFVNAGLVDEIIVYMAPKILGSDAKPLFELAGFKSLDHCIELQCQEIRQVGPDVRLLFRPIVPTNSIDRLNRPIKKAG
jgi:diaminohydroxyphosphoribosylaminopyrimidine deaminase/5-amino-6-(5-phosphoribosylamino)uracil reductase